MFDAEVFAPQQHVVDVTSAVAVAQAAPPGSPPQMSTALGEPHVSAKMPWVMLVW